MSTSVHCSLVVTCWKRAGLLALLYVMFSAVFVTFTCGVPGQLWYLIVSIPDLCLLTLNQYLAEDEVTCSRTYHSASGESKTNDPLISVPNVQPLRPGRDHIQAKTCRWLCTPDVHLKCSRQYILGVHVLVAQHVGDSVSWVSMC